MKWCFSARNFGLLLELQRMRSSIAQVCSILVRWLISQASEPCGKTEEGRAGVAVEGEALFLFPHLRPLLPSSSGSCFVTCCSVDVVWTERVWQRIGRLWTRARRRGHPDGILLGRLVTARVLASEFFFLFFLRRLQGWLVIIFCF